MKKSFGILFCLFVFILLVVFSPQASDSCRSALEVCGRLIIPSLFPFFIVSIMANRLGLPEMLGKMLAPVGRRLFGVSGAGLTAFFVGLTGGYPMGAAYIADMVRSGSVSANEGERLLGFCNNSGPAFLIGAIGNGLFGSSMIGVKLYLIHALSAVTVGILMSKKLPDSGLFNVPAEPQNKEYRSFIRVFPGAVVQAAEAIVNVCGFVICFTVIIGLLDARGFLSCAAGRISALTGAEISWVRSLFCGIFELGCGISEMRSFLPTPEALALAAFLVGWGGLSVQLQSFSLLSDTELKGTLHITGHLLSAGISAIYALLLFKI